MKRAGRTRSARDPDDARAVVERPALYRVLEGDSPLAGGARYFIDELDAVTIGRSDGPRFAHHAYQGMASVLQIGVPDERISSEHAKIERRGSGWVLTDLGSKNGTYVDGESAASRALVDGDVIEVGRTFFRFRSVIASRTADDLDTSELMSELPALRTLVPSLAESFRMVKKMARSPMAVLIHGETGTGKEMLARAVHEASGLRGPLVVVNSGAIAETLLESELFGVRKGAYSGAHEDRLGFFRAAQGGTLFLDEVGEMPPSMQVKLLRAIQEREIVPVGSTDPIRIDVRFVAATNRDLRARVAQGAFREDLYARLCGYEIRLPPVRERPDDLGVLVASLLPRVTDETVKLDAKAGRALLRYPFPRNVRELELALGVAVAASAGMLIKIGHLPKAIAEPEPLQNAAPNPQAPNGTIAAASKARRPDRGELVAALDELDWNIAAVAKRYGKDPRQIRRWVEHYKLADDD